MASPIENPTARVTLAVQVDPDDIPNEDEYLAAEELELVDAATQTIESYLTSLLSKRRRTTTSSVSTVATNTVEDEFPEDAALKTLQDCSTSTGEGVIQDVVVKQDTKSLAADKSSYLNASSPITNTTPTTPTNPECLVESVIENVGRVGPSPRSPKQPEPEPEQEQEVQEPESATTTVDSQFEASVHVSAIDVTATESSEIECEAAVEKSQAPSHTSCTSNAESEPSPAPLEEKDSSSTDDEGTSRLSVPSPPPPQAVPQVEVESTPGSLQDPTISEKEEEAPSVEKVEEVSVQDQASPGLIKLRDISFPPSYPSSSSKTSLTEGEPELTGLGIDSKDVSIESSTSVPSVPTTTTITVPSTPVDKTISVDTITFPKPLNISDSIRNLTMMKAASAPSSPSTSYNPSFISQSPPTLPPSSSPSTHIPPVPSVEGVASVDVGDHQDGAPLLSSSSNTPTSMSTPTRPRSTSFHNITPSSSQHSLASSIASSSSSTNSVVLSTTTTTASSKNKTNISTPTTPASASTLMMMDYAVSTLSSPPPSNPGSRSSSPAPVPAQQLHTSSNSNSRRQTFSVGTTPMAAGGGGEASVSSMMAAAAFHLQTGDTPLPVPVSSTDSITAATAALSGRRSRGSSFGSGHYSNYSLHNQVVQGVGKGEKERERELERAERVERGERRPSSTTPSIADSIHLAIDVDALPKLNLPPLGVGELVDPETAKAVQHLITPWPVLKSGFVLRKDLYSVNNGKSSFQPQNRLNSTAPNNHNGAGNGSASAGATGRNVSKSLGNLLRRGRKKRSKDVLRAGSGSPNSAGAGAGGANSGLASDDASLHSVSEEPRPTAGKHQPPHQQQQSSGGLLDLDDGWVFYYAEIRGRYLVFYGISTE
ncbi:hypothetical protein HK102_007458, partial [Quaeritorhiza haematococci]